jgi:Phosphotransferase enzyme family
MIALPTCIDAITADWLSEALAAPVNAIEVEDVITGAATKVRVRLSGPNVPHTVIVKAPLSRAKRNADILSFFALEVAFYRDVAALLDVGLPRCLYAETREDEGQALVILEDLRGAHFFKAGDTMSADEAARVLDVYARMHATTWAHPVLNRIACYPGTMRPVLAGMLSGRYWDGCLRRPRSAALPAPLREPGAMRAAIEALWASDADAANCVVHGDAHIGNVYRASDGSHGVLDWQMFGRGHWCHDVAYFITSALDPAQRAACEVELLRNYLDCLLAHGGPRLSFDIAWNDYRRHLIHGLYWATNADGMYPEEINACVVERFSRAIAELDTLAVSLVTT